MCSPKLYFSKHWAVTLVKSTKSLTYFTVTCSIVAVLYLIRESSHRDVSLDNMPLEYAKNKTQLSSQNSTTLVTALYDIDRLKQGRSLEEYLQWIEQTLQLNCPFIIYTSRILAVRIRLMRRGRLAAKTLLIERDNIPLGEFADLIETRIFPRFRSKMRHPQDITNTNKMYAIINHAKMNWLNEAIALNPFGTNTFFWIDAGFSRFIKKEYYSRPFPFSLAKLNMLIASNRAFVAVASASDQELNLSKELDLTDIVGSNKNFFRGGFWGGHFDAVRKLAVQTLAVFFEMLSRDMIDNEQISLFLVYRKAPELFLLHRTDSVACSFDYIATE